MTAAPDLSHFTGTETWWRHPLSKQMLYTDGVKYFADQVGAHWFLDIVATEYWPLQAKEEFMVITLHAAEGKAKIVVDDGNDNEVTARKFIDYTDCPDGAWKFYLENNVLCLPSER